MPSTIEAAAVTGNASCHGAPTGSDFGITELRVRAFRSIVDLRFVPGRFCALVGEARAGKSNLLAAANVLLDSSATLSAADETTLAERPIVVEAALETELHGRRHKPERAWRSFTGMSRAELPQPFLEAVETVVALARGEAKGEAR